MAASIDITAQLAKLRTDYLQQLPDKLGELQMLLGSIKQQYSRSAVEVFHRQIHSLTGSGASYGMPRLSETARLLEHRVKAALTNGQAIDQEEYTEWGRLLYAVVESAGEPPQDGPTIQNRKSDALVNENAARTVFVLDDERSTGEFLADQLRYFGYQATAFQEPDALYAAIEKTPADAIIVDINLKDGKTGMDAVRAIPRTLIADTPIVFVSGRDDLAARLECVRAGGRGYFHKPVNVDLLVDHIDHLTQRNITEPFRVLIVDDAEALARLYATTLESTGMITHIVTDPMQLMEAIQEFNPELILMDMYMPDAHGDELAKVIRQDPAHVSVPIVFLSGETDTDRQLAAIRIGGDEFLTKPIDLSHLVSAVNARVERYRILRGFMQRDSLTGLLNHTKSKEFLQSEVSRAQREKYPLSFAMLDIDHFKGVNDTYGHPVGDRVIKGLARMLQQRLRKSDIIGRYGGEEFAVVMPNTKADVACKVLNELRETFSNVTFVAGETNFKCSFSCGVAEACPSENATELIRRADEALYSAKHGGRNQVVSADAAGQTPQ